MAPRSVGDEADVSDHAVLVARDDVHTLEQIREPIPDGVDADGRGALRALLGVERVVHPHEAVEIRLAVRSNRHLPPGGVDERRRRRLRVDPFGPEARHRAANDPA